MKADLRHLLPLFACCLPRSACIDVEARACYHCIPSPEVNCSQYTSNQAKLCEPGENFCKVEYGRGLCFT